MQEQITGYDLSRAWFDFSFNNPELINPSHAALYFFAIEHCNRLGWKKKFGLPTTMAMEAIGIKSYKTYKKVLTELVQWGFIVMVEESRNQYSSNVVSLEKNTKAPTKALTKAMLKHVSKQVQSTDQSNASIDKPLTIEPLTNNHRTVFTPPTKEDVITVMQEKLDDFTAMAQAEMFVSYYQANGWMVGKNKMKDWKAAVVGWISRMKNYNPSAPVKKPVLVQDPNNHW